MSGEIKDQLSVGEISEMLRRDADSVARALLPRGAYEMGNREWRCTGSNSPTGTAISVYVGSGPKQGVCGFWNEAKEGGDLINLYQKVNNCSPREAVAWAKEWLGIGPAPATRGNLAQQRRDLEKQRLARDEKRRRSAKNIRRLASGIWRSCRPLSAEGEVYLSGRGLDPAFAGTEIRFHPHLQHPTGQSFPALVGRVSIGERGVGIWRTYLKPTGEGKAPVDNPKLGLGDCIGGAVRIGGIWTEIGVTEGKETGIAVRQLIHKWTGKHMPVWAALSSSGMAGLIVPEGEVKMVRIFCDNDPVKFREDEMRQRAPSAGVAAAGRLAERLRAAGIEVHIHVPPVGMDWLDVLLANKAQQEPMALPMAA